MSVLLNGTLKIQIFGESHSESIGAVIENFPAGMKVDFGAMSKKLERRRASLTAYSTKRIEPDAVEVQSGIFNGFTTGASICLLIRNTNVKSQDYENIKRVARPSHADFPAHVKYGGFEDYRGGGQFSGRLTAPIVAAGALCEQWIGERGVKIAAHIRSIAGIREELAPELLFEYAERLKEPIAVVSDEIRSQMLEKIAEVAAQKSSCGGLIECAIRGLPAGRGATMAASVESRLASLLYAVPAVKGVSFGLGFGFADAFGRECNDEYGIRNGKIVPLTNRNGGVLGGITTGADVVFSAAFKPVSSIAAEQNSVDLETRTEAKLTVKGRHDVCIVPRAVPVVESVAAIAAADLLLETI